MENRNENKVPNLSRLIGRYRISAGAHKLQACLRVLSACEIREKRKQLTLNFSNTQKAISCRVTIISGFLLFSSTLYIVRSHHTTLSSSSPPSSFSNPPRAARWSQLGAINALPKSDIHSINRPNRTRNPIFNG